MGPDRQLYAKWPVGLDPVEVEHAFVLCDNEVHGLSGLLGHMLEDLVSCDGGVVGRENI